jgi:benzoyl-CoA 2,3-dioxygenase component B
VSLDLFGAETSTNAANYFAAGLKGRFQEERRDDDHQLKGSIRLVPDCTGGDIGAREVAQLAALNETLREDYIEDCQKGVERWNRTLADVGIDRRLALPHLGFHRNVGTFAARSVTPDGHLVSDAEWAANADRWLPSQADRAHVTSLMVGVAEPGRMAGWVAPPSRGIHQKPIEYEYVLV